MYDATSQKFFLMALIDESGTGTQGRIAYATFDPAATPAQTPAWRPVKINNEFVTPGDKPWLATGVTTTEQTEFYLTYYDDDDELLYLRTVDLGQTWTGGEMGFVGNYPTCSVSADGPLYVGYQTLAGQFRFLVGEDQTNGTVSFTALMADASTPLAFTPRAEDNSLSNYLPIPGGAVAQQYALPMIATDPTDPNALYVTYQDVADTDPTGEYDVNVYFRKLTKGSNGYWTVGDEITVNDDEQLFVADQFVPAIAVDGNGRIHITFYDDRDYEDQPDNPTPVSSAETKMKVFYTFSDDAEDFAENQRLFLEEDDPEDPPVFDCEHEVVLGFFEVGEYMGLTIRNKPGGGYEMWATYTGSLPATYDPDDSTLICASVVPQ